MNEDELNPRVPSEEELDDVFELLATALSAFPDMADASMAAPPSVVAGAQWVHDWVNLDAELARLTHDSSTDRSLAGVRSTNSLRHITFSAPSYEIEIEIEPDERGVSLTGVVAPPVSGTVQAVIGAVSYRGEIDDLGTFVIDKVNHGVVMAYITTDAGTIRLGSFEV